MMSSCPTCSIIAAKVVEWSRSSNGAHIDASGEELGTWQDYVDRQECEICQSVVSYLLADDGNGAVVRSPQCTMSFTLDEGRFVIGGTPFCYSDARPEHVCQTPHRYLELYPPSTYRFNGDGEYFTKVDFAWIDVSRISRWLKHCGKEHGKDCMPTLSRRFPGPARMIDVEQNCIVDNIDWPRYVALSYVWGAGLPGLATLKSNAAGLHQPGALSDDRNEELLAATVRDAMVLARRLGFKYLWADRLCIVQDDNDDKMNEIKLMGDIYRNAALTIIAMDGQHADYGLPGISSPRKHEQFILDITPDVQLLGAPVRERKSTQKTWHTRAWTYQERLLSSRKLCFFNGSYFWECSSTHWTEDISTEADDSTVDNFYYRSLSSATTGVIDENPFPDLRQYCNLVEEYCTRRIGFDTDALDACSAILARLRPTFPGGFHFGLPEFYFDIALLWVPIRPVTRRPEFPSWSWLGWKDGAIAHVPIAQPYYPAMQYQGTGASLDELTISPVVKWYRTARLFPADDFRLNEIDNTYHIWRARGHLNHFQGWTKTGTTWNQTSNPEKSFNFLYPIPFGQRINLRHELDCQLHCRQHLTFTTRRGFVKTAGIAGKAFLEHETFMINLADEEGRWVGVLSSNITDPAQELNSEKCEVIVVSEGVAKGKSVQSAFLEVRTAKELKGLETYEFFNVLAIGRRGDVAFRTGVGRVWKRAWERLESEVVDVKLG